jgi:hypothetical protein
MGRVGDSVDQVIAARCSRPVAEVGEWLLALGPDRS